MKPTVGWSLAAFLAVAAAIVLFNRPSPSTAPRGGAESSGSPGAVSSPSLASSASARPPASPVAPRVEATPSPAFVEPEGPLKDNLDRLKRDATAGDNAAAYYLGTRLFECRIATSGGNVTVSDSEGLPGMSADCRGLTNEDVKTFKHWLELAADRGDPEAQVSYSAIVGASITATDAIRDPEGVADYKRRAMDYLNRAAANGSVPALGRLSTNYGNGIVAPQNLQLAYAYQLAYLQASGLGPSALEEQYAQHLTEGEKEQARTLAQRFVSTTRH